MREDADEVDIVSGWDEEADTAIDELDQMTLDWSRPHAKDRLVGKQAARRRPKAPSRSPASPGNETPPRIVCVVRDHPRIPCRDTRHPPSLSARAPESLAIVALPPARLTSLHRHTTVRDRMLKPLGKLARRPPNPLTNPQHPHVQVPSSISLASPRKPSPVAAASPRRRASTLCRVWPLVV
ncbi:Aste57867_8227 [Aphanomyces stellatus]|uniref:Aste57867_8227 protein n=1 Tax=Aphanomyces stellatus TaxID=120398 RepID=A0A485KJQ1_9STRA|nr:hypothetical protein As57867_008196 [Aphanomyces stellatus]VFT85114.1 Aste57867_8227 [Aphanomyces stellatus]